MGSIFIFLNILLIQNLKRKILLKYRDKPKKKKNAADNNKKIYSRNSINIEI